jgi:hypothetical protein
MSIHLTIWRYGRLSEMDLTPGPYWFTGVLVVNTITGSSQHVIADSRAEVPYVTPTGATWGKYRATYFRGQWMPDTGIHPGPPPASAWPDAQGRVPTP